MRLAATTCLARYVLAVRVTDHGGSSASGNVVVDVLNVNDTAVFGFEGATLMSTQGNQYVSLKFSHLLALMWAWDLDLEREIGVAHWCMLARGYLTGSSPWWEQTLGLWTKLCLLCTTSRMDQTGALLSGPQTAAGYWAQATVVFSAGQHQEVGTA
jgi:hypothetical protein